MNILELRRGGRTGVQLQPENTGQVALTGIVVGHLGRQPAIDLEDQMRSLADQVILMPRLEFEPRVAPGLGDLSVRGFAVLIEHRALTAPGQRLPAVLIVEAHQPVRVEIVVHLIAGQVVIGPFPAAELEAVVNAFGTEDPGFQLQFKVRQLAALPDQIQIFLEGMFRGDPAGNRAVRNGPIAHVGGVPARKGLAIEQIGESLIGDGNR